LSAEVLAIPNEKEANMTAAEAIIQVLRDHHALRIRFSFEMVTGGTMTVNNSTFARVAHAIEQGTIIVVVDPRRTPDDAEYDDQPLAGTTGSGVFKVSPRGHGSRIWKGVVVHESVHASLDLVRSSFSWVDNEAAAFMASAMYWVSCGLPATRFHGEYEEFVRTAALHALGTGVVDQAALRTLRSAMRADNYDEGLMVSHGAWARGRGGG
jgi:hypothetical protein